MFRPLICAVIAGFSLQISSASAEQLPPVQPEQVIDEALLGKIRAWAANPIVALAIKAQNARLANATAAEVTKLDEQWATERKAAKQPLIATSLARPLSIYLLRIQAGSKGVFTEIIAMDNHGLNAGQTTVTSDYWQGDEGKFQKTFEVGPDAVFIDKPEFDEATKAWHSQVSMTVVDPNSKEKIGALTVEVNLTELQRRATS